MTTVIRLLYGRTMGYLKLKYLGSAMRTIGGDLQALKDPVARVASFIMIGDLKQDAVSKIADPIATTQKKTPPCRAIVM